MTEQLATEPDDPADWRDVEAEIDGGYSGCEFPRLWPPRRRVEEP